MFLKLVEAIALFAEEIVAGVALGWNSSAQLANDIGNSQCERLRRGASI